MLITGTLTEWGGTLVVLDPRPSVARVLALLDLDQMVTIRRKGPLPTTGGFQRAQREAHRKPAPGRTRRAGDEHGVD
ncbi:MAG: hypothetical protein ACTHJW_23135 [Streptosporangiaceae bacterium]